MGRAVTALIMSLWIIPISVYVNRIVPEPYMDEVFHIPQAQQYCKGNFRSWDPMITTPPGLYYLSLVHIASLFPGMSYVKSVTSVFELCSAAVLRSINGVLAVICSFLIHEILTELKPALSKRKTAFQAVVLSLYPLHWFFTFLYYTDVASVTIVLAMYLTCLRQHFQLSALLGALAILIRQTNVVWMVLVASTGILKCVTPSNCRGRAQPDDQDESPWLKYNAVHDTASVPIGSNLRKRKSGTSLTATGRYISKRTDSPISASGFFDEAQVILERLWFLKWKIFCHLAHFWWYYWHLSPLCGGMEVSFLVPKKLTCLSTLCTNNVLWSDFFLGYGSYDFQLYPIFSSLSVTSDEQTIKLLSNIHCSYCRVPICTFLQHRASLSYSRQSSLHLLYLAESHRG